VLRTRKYTVLLAILLTALVLQSFAITLGSKKIEHDVMATVLGVAVFLVVFERSAVRTVMAVVLLLALSITWARYLPVSSFLHVLTLTRAICLAIFFWVTVWVILSHLFRTSVIGADNVLGAICGYLIAGQGWAFFNVLGYVLVPAAYFLDPKVAPQLADWHGQNALFAYYSYMQMLTMGYAAVVPLAAPATTLSLLASLFGLFYTAVIVSQLVGMAHSKRKEPPDDG
jgi:hypothetical protein